MQRLACAARSLRRAPTFAIPLMSINADDYCRGSLGASREASILKRIFLGLAMGLLSGVLAYGASAAHLGSRNSWSWPARMPSFGDAQVLTPTQIDDLTQYVLALSRRESDEAAVLRAVPLFSQQCASCHGIGGEGAALLWVPDLSDGIWIYGPTPSAIRTQIWHGANGRGPPRQARLSAQVNAP